MKFKHHFELVYQTESMFHFKSEEVNVRLDFLKNAYRVAIYRDGERIFPTFSVCPDGVMPFAGRDKLSVEGLEQEKPKVSVEKEKVSFICEDYQLSISLQNFELSCYQNGQLLYKDREYISYNFEHELGKGSCHYISREEDEEIFGLGDKTGDINKSHRNFRLGTDDSMGFDARYSDPLYKHVPFYMCKNSVGSYGIFYDTYSDGQFDFGREHNNYYTPFKSFVCEEETLVYYVMLGSVPKVLNSFAHLRGKDFMPPYWTFKYCGSTMTYTDAPDADKQLRGFVDLCSQYGLNPGGFYLSSGYTQIGEKRYVFNWNTDKIPSPRNLSAYFMEHGLEFLPNIKPCLLTDHPMYQDIDAAGLFLKDKDGKSAVFPFWGGFGSYLDFTNPKAADFWTKCVKEKLVDQGYRNTWNDNNEYDINDEEVYAEGFGEKIPAKLIKPLFSYLMTRASLKAQNDEIRKVAVSRCGTTGLSRIASTWTGDNKSDFSDFRYNHKMAMTMSLSGIYNFGQDIGGFAGPLPGKELLLRWIQYGIFTPRFVIHSWNMGQEPTMPWTYPEEMDTVKALFKLREKLTPYLYNETWRSTNDYNPIIYPLFLKYPEYDVETDAFFFGNSIVAIPVFDQGVEEVSVDLPENNGFWYRGDFMQDLSGKKKDTGVAMGRVTAKVTVHDEPLYFIKGGSVIFDGEQYRIYPMEKGVFTATYLQDDGEAVLACDNHRIVTFTVTCDEKTVAVKKDIRGSLDGIAKEKCTEEQLRFLKAFEEMKIVLVDAFGRELAVTD